MYLHQRYPLKYISHITATVAILLFCNSHEETVKNIQNRHEQSPQLSKEMENKTTQNQVRSFLTSPIKEVN